MLQQENWENESQKRKCMNGRRNVENICLYINQNSFFYFGIVALWLLLTGQTTLLRCQ